MNIKKPTKKRLVELRNNLLLTLLSALLFFLMVHFQFWFLVWFCLVPILYVAYKEETPYILIFGSLLAFLIALTSFYWLRNYYLGFLGYAVLFITLFGFVCSLLVLILNKTFKGKSLKIFFLPIAWLFLIFLFSFHSYGNSWMTFSFLFPMMSPVILYIGNIGVTFLIIFTNSTIADYFLYKNKKILYLSIILILIPIFCYSYSYYAGSNIQGESVSVALIQGNFNQSWGWRYFNTSIILDRYEELSLQASEQDVDFIIWPEYAIPNDLFKDHELYNRISNLAKKTNSYLVLGTIVFEDKEKVSPAEIKTNSAIVFSPNGGVVSRYDSIAPAPEISTVISGDKSLVVNTDKGSFTIGLCYEEYLGADLFKQESDFIIIMSNNQAFDNTLGMKVISQFSRLRASESKRYVVRSTNTGLTQIINPYGKVVDKIEPYKPGILISEIYI